jgi:hypothetical protein
MAAAARPYSLEATKLVASQFLGRLGAITPTPPPPTDAIADGDGIVA